MNESEIFNAIISLKEGEEKFIEYKYKREREILWRDIETNEYPDVKITNGYACFYYATKKIDILNESHYIPYSFLTKNSKIFNEIDNYLINIKKQNKELILKNKPQIKFDRFFIDLMIDLYNKKQINNTKYDYICYVPPTESGDLVKNLVLEFGKCINIPVLCDFIFLNKKIKPQKYIFGKQARIKNVKNCYSLLKDINIKNKNILLIDDFEVDGSVILEIANLLTLNGVNMITPMVLGRGVWIREEK
ncbi:MAG: ComF family protein [Rickettsiales bacterium]|nr:MAG: ComF family protein [Rickettsiales bacterium]